MSLCVRIGFDSAVYFIPNRHVYLATWRARERDRDKELKTLCVQILSEYVQGYSNDVHFAW